MGSAMNVMSIGNIGKIEPPSHPVTDFSYETDLQEALEPALSVLIDAVESAGWDRRKAAYAVMVLAARHLSEARQRSANGSSVR
jgi:hypothetical protein